MSSEETPKDHSSSVNKEKSVQDQAAQNTMNNSTKRIATTGNSTSGPPPKKRKLYRGMDLSNYTPPTQEELDRQDREYEEFLRNRPPTPPPYTAEEKQYLKDYWVSEWYFLRRHGRIVYNSSDRDEGRVLVRKYMAQLAAENAAASDTSDPVGRTIDKEDHENPIIKSENNDHRPAEKVFDAVEGSAGDVKGSEKTVERADSAECGDSSNEMGAARDHGHGTKKSSGNTKEESIVNDVNDVGIKQEKGCS